MVRMHYAGKSQNLRGILIFTALLSSFILVLSILVFQIGLVSGKIKGNSALLAAILVAFMSSICLFAFVGVMMAGIGSTHP